MGEEKRPEWMTNISSIVNPQDYLLGRKIDKTFELSQKEKIEKAREERIELISKDKIKLSDDPILDLERRRRQLKIELIQNPVLLKQFREKLLRGDFKNKIGQSSQTTSDTTPKHEQTDGADNSRLNCDKDSRSKSVERESRHRSEYGHGSSSRHSKTRRHDDHNRHHHRDRDRHEKSGSSRRHESDRDSRNHHRFSDKYHDPNRKDERRYTGKSPSRHHRKRSRSPRSR